MTMTCHNKHYFWTVFIIKIYFKYTTTGSETVSIFKGRNVPAQLDPSERASLDHWVQRPQFPSKFIYGIDLVFEKLYFKTDNGQCPK